MPDPSQIGLSVASLAGYELDDAIRAGRELGFGAIEVLGFEGERHSQGLLCGFDFAERPPHDLEQLAAALSDYEFVSVHAPFIAVPMLSPNTGIQREAMRQMEASIRGTSAIGGTVCTVHLNGVPFRTLDDTWPAALGALRRLGDVGESCGVTVALETGYPNSVDTYCGLIEAAQHGFVGACIDVGHIFAYYPTDRRGTEQGVEVHNDLLNTICERLGPKLAVFHLHDNRREDFRDHRAPGRGIIDYQRLLRTLDAAEFRGPMVLELEEPDLVPAMEEGRDLLLSLMDEIEGE